MKQIFSKIEPGLLLHQVFRYNQISNEREDIVPENDTIVYEFKTGPYLGIEFDKKFI